MKSPNTELSVACDIDGTIVDTLTPEQYTKYKGPKFKIENPYQPGTYLLRSKRMKNINLVKDLKGRGYKVTVWSHGGELYAKAIVEALELKAYVDETRAKFTKHIDDRADVESLVGMRVFIDE